MTTISLIQCNAFSTTYFSDGDHAQSSYKVHPNDDVTNGCSMHVHCLFCSRRFVHLQDEVKRSLKETTSNPSNPNGFTQTVLPSEESRLYDTAKTSKKETVLFDHTGGARGSTLQGTAQDQYFRADLNPNKEIIAQGRDPTPESTKLANGMDTINLDIKKIESDYFTLIKQALIGYIK